MAGAEDRGRGQGQRTGAEDRGRGYCLMSLCRDMLGNPKLH